MSSPSEARMESAEEPEIIKKTIITILIVSHGQDIPKTRFHDPAVRMFSIAGRSGSIGYSSQSYRKITAKFEEGYKQYERDLMGVGFYKRGKPDYAKLRDLCPTANESDGMPDITIQSGGGVPVLSPLSSLSFIKDIFEDDGRGSTGHFFDRPTKSNYRAHSIADPVIRGHEDMFQLTKADATEGFTHRLHVPVINKQYIFEGASESNPFGIFVMSTSNTTDKSQQIKGMNLIATGAVGKSGKVGKGKQFNLEFEARLEENDHTVHLDELCAHLHGLGFEVINIIDTSCRTCRLEDLLPSDVESPKGSSRRTVSRRRVSALEDEASGALYKASKSPKSPKSPKSSKSSSLGGKHHMTKKRRQ